MAKIQHDENGPLDHLSPRCDERSPSDKDEVPLTEAASKDVADVLSVLTLGRRSNCDFEVTPVHRMVPELLLEIFAYCLPPFIDDISSMDPEPMTSLPMNFSPWLISHVCQGWRKVIFDSPSCWTNVWIIFRDNKYTVDQPASDGVEPRWKSVLEIISWQIRLSYKQPIHLFFDAGDISNEQLSAISSLVLAHQNRWETIAFRSTAQSHPDDLRTFGQLFGVRGSNFSLLKKLEIHMTEPGGFIVAASHRGYGWQFPVLEHVSMFGGMVGIFPHLDTLPWSNITFLSLDFVRLGDVHSILPYLKKLRELEVLDYFSVDGVGPTPEVLRVPATLPRLKVLHICDRARFRLLNAITTPSLGHLECTRGLQPNDSATDVLSIIAFIQRSGCSITDYTGSIYTSNSEGLLPTLLSVLPRLRTLRIRMREFDFRLGDVGAYIPNRARIGDLMGALSARNEDGSFSACPLLADITVVSDDWCLIDHEEVVSLVDVCESRFNRGRGHLRSMVFPMHATDWNEPPASQQLHRLIGLHNAGLHVEISNWDGCEWDFVGHRWVREPIHNIDGAAATFYEF